MNEVAQVASQVMPMAEFVLIIAGIQTTMLLTVFGFLWKHFNYRFDKMDARFDKMDARFDKMEEKFERLSKDFADVKMMLFYSHGYVVKSEEEKIKEKK